MPRPMRPSPMKPTFSICSTLTCSLSHGEPDGLPKSHAGPRMLSTQVRSGGRNSANYNHKNGARVDNNDLPCGWAHTRERLDVCSVRHDHQRPVGPCVQDRARVAPQLLTPISEHESVAKRWLDVDGPEIHQFCRLNAAA